VRELVIALIAAVVVGIPVAKYFSLADRIRAGRAAKPYIDAMTHERARSNGYEHRLVDEKGVEIGVVSGSTFSLTFYRPGDDYEYKSMRYEVVSVTDDYPAATGTIVLKRL
jgi:hypothetical protein